MTGSRSRTSTLSNGSISSRRPKLVKSPASTKTSASSRTRLNWSCRALKRAGVKCRSAVAAILIRFQSCEIPFDCSSSSQHSSIDGRDNRSRDLRGPNLSCQSKRYCRQPGCRETAPSDQDVVEPPYIGEGDPAIPAPVRSPCERDRYTGIESASKAQSPSARPRDE